MNTVKPKRLLAGEGVESLLFRGQCYSPVMQAGVTVYVTAQPSRAGDFRQGPHDAALQVFRGIVSSFPSADPWRMVEGPKTML